MAALIIGDRLTPHFPQAIILSYKVAIGRDFEVFALKGLDYRTANAIIGLSLAGLARAVAWVGMQFLSHPLS